MKSSIKLLILTLVLAPLLIGCGCEKKNENKKPSDKKPENNLVTLGDQTIEGIKFSGFNIIYDKEKMTSTMVVNVQNTNKKDYKLEMIDINLYDKDKKLVVKTSGHVGATLKPNLNKTIESIITIDLTKVTKVVYKIRK